MNLFRVNIAAIGRVLPKVPLISDAFSFGAGTWKGMTARRSDLELVDSHPELTEVSPPHIFLSRHNCRFVGAMRLEALLMKAQIWLWGRDASLSSQGNFKQFDPTNRLLLTIINSYKKTFL